MPILDIAFAIALFGGSAAFGASVTLLLLRGLEGMLGRRRAATRERLAAAARRHIAVVAPEGPAALALAEKRAIALLKEWLSPSQLFDYESTGTFVVVGSSTRARYQISSRASYNVWDLQDRSYCFGPLGVPLGDVLLAQKIALENFEGKALATANCYVHRPARPFCEYRV